MNSASQTFQVPGTNYDYTGTPIASLTSSHNTIAVVLSDESGSTRYFRNQIEQCEKSIVKRLRSGPHADHLLYALFHFDTRFREVHGFKPISQCNEGDYDGSWQGGGQTTLYDSTDKVLAFVDDYGHRQAALHYPVNGIILVITDGMDYGSTLKVTSVKERLAKIMTDETGLESIVVILIGINDDPEVQKGLQKFAATVGLDQLPHQYIPAKDFDAARIADFADRSISSQSQALGSNGPSQPLVF